LVFILALAEREAGGNGIEGFLVIITDITVAVGNLVKSKVRRNHPDFGWGKSDSISTLQDY